MLYTHIIYQQIASVTNAPTQDTITQQSSWVENGPIFFPEKSHGVDLITKLI